MGPCLCGDPYCGLCGDPEGMRAIDGEIDRVEATGFADAERLVECSCGVTLIGHPEPNEVPCVYLHRICAACWAADHAEPDTVPEYAREFDEVPW